MIRIKKKPSAAQVMAFGFAAIILLGGLLLMLPVCNRSGQSIPFLNALFTSTSATCVTGLVVYDTYTQFTFWGQLIILLLIEIGGLGFMTVALLFSMALGRRIGLKERSLLAETVSAMQIGGVVRLLRHVLLGTLFFEGAGAALLSFRFIPEFGLARGIWYGMFHAVSAFCNAGFDLMGVRAPFSSLTGYAGDPLVILTIASLIIIGGLGFIVWDDLRACGRHWRRYALHTKVVLACTGALILGGTLLMLLLEHGASLAGLRDGKRLLAAFFQAVTPRTAGFNSVDLARLGHGGRLLITLLMFVGASPGSTAGGVKTTTLTVVLASLSSYLRGRRDVNLFHYQIEPQVVRRAYCSMTLYTLLILGGSFVLTAQGAAAERAVFETVSAIGTVGLSLGLTPLLPALSRLALILLMYAGRVGSLSVFMAVTEARQPDILQNPVGKITIG